MKVNGRSEANLRLKVTPNAGRNEVVGFSDDILHVRVVAPPIEGKANRELTAFLSQTLGVSRSSLTIIKGHTSRNKIIAVNSLSQADILNRLGY